MKIIIAILFLYPLNITIHETAITVFHIDAAKHNLIQRRIGFSRGLNSRRIK